MPKPALVLPALAAGLFLIGFLDFLWVFPLHSSVRAWFLLASLDTFLALQAHVRVRAGRPLLWIAGILWFAADAPILGVTMVALPAALWVAERRGSKRFFPFVILLCAIFLLFGHRDELTHAGMKADLLNIRFSVHLLAAFYFFRMISWSLSTRIRGERVSFLTTVEYFLSPAFWLSPLHTNHLTFRAPGVRVFSWRPVAWIFRGIAHGLIFSWLASIALPWLGELYAGGAREMSWRVVPACFVIFALAYFEKSRVSYLAAGFLRLNGFAVEPDFNAPWMARSLPEYWRRFHYWVWEFYLDTLYFPLSALLSRWVSAERAAIGGIFLTFLLGTALSHFVAYPAPLGIALILGLLFGVFTAVHAVFAARFGRFGLPLTWLSVFFLYALAYPAFGLGWGFGDFLRFWR